jgi:transcriptional regulator with XRE-family HTH domain
LTGDHLAWQELADKAKELREERGLTREQINERYGIGADTIRLIEKKQKGSISRTTIAFLSVIYQKQPDYLENTLKRLPVDETPVLTVASAQDTLQGFMDSLDSMRADAQRYLGVLRQSSATIAVEIRAWQHGAVGIEAAPHDGDTSA